MKRRNKTAYRFQCRQGQLSCRAFSLRDAIALLYSRHPKAEILSIELINGKGDWQAVNPYNWEVIADQLKENAA